MTNALDITIQPRFADLRSGHPWTPRFHQQPSLSECADHINRPHEDYPKRNYTTERAIADVLSQNPAAITTDLLMQVHAAVFDDTTHAGRLRQIPVRIGPFIPPVPAMLPRLMHNLETAYAATDLDTGTLVSWYADFETIHPFQDGNGRVGGIIIAALNRRNDPSYWLAPGQ